MAVLLTLAIAYAGHFQNGFHFDDFHTITDNPYVRDPNNIPRFFTDARKFSTLPENQSYRPVVSASLALDYWLAKGLNPVWYHASTFFWFLVQLAAMFVLFRRIAEIADPHPANSWFALLAVACYALHPANAETINYIVQRGEIYSTLGPVAALAIYAAAPRSRARWWYLLPILPAVLAKPPALVFPALLTAYIYLFERERDWRTAARAALPAWVLCGAAGLLLWRMTPATFAAGAGSWWPYWITQPFAALHYFKTFFLPTELSADTDWTPLPGVFSTQAVVGMVFVLALIYAAMRASRLPRWRPLSFGLAWFLLALVPASAVRLAEVINDHRMYFPFVGLALAVPWTARAWLLAEPRRLRRGLAAACCFLAAAATATYQRSAVWRTEETLWRDVTRKSPRNGRGWMNYGLSLMARGDYAGALASLNTAQALAPAYPLVEINLGIVKAALDNHGEAERHFRQALALGSKRAEPHFYYGRWLRSRRRTDEAVAHLSTAVGLNPLFMEARRTLLAMYSEQRDWAAFDRLAADTQRLVPGDAPTIELMAAHSQRGREVAALEQVVRRDPSPERYLDLSLAYYRQGRYSECIETARRAVGLKPEYAEAYNNMAAGYNSLGLWDDGIRAAQEAVRLKPDFELAKNNLAHALSRKQADGR